MAKAKELGETPDAGFRPSSFEIPLYPEEEPTGRIKNVIFDWYGTIYNCMHLFPVVFSEEMYRRFQIPKEFAYRNFRLNPGFSISEQIEDLLGSERFGKFDRTVMRATENALYSRLDDLEADIFDDAPGTLFRFLRSGYNLSILSKNKEASLRAQVEKKGLTNFFKFVVGRDSCEECSDKGEGLIYLSELHQKPYGKFIPETVIVTDTTADARKFALSGVPVIARTGFSYPKSGVLYRAKADYVVNSFKDLYSVVSTM